MHTHGQLDKAGTGGCADCKGGSPSKIKVINWLGKHLPDIAMAATEDVQGRQSIRMMNTAYTNSTSTNKQQNTSGGTKSAACATPHLAARRQMRHKTHPPPPDYPTHIPLQSFTHLCMALQLPVSRGPSSSSSEPSSSSSSSAPQPLQRDACQQGQCCRCAPGCAGEAVLHGTAAPETAAAAAGVGMPARDCSCCS